MVVQLDKSYICRNGEMAKPEKNSGGSLKILSLSRDGSRRQVQTETDSVTYTFNSKTVLWMNRFGMNRLS